MAKKPMPKTVAATYRKGGFIASDPHAFDAMPEPVAPRILALPGERVTDPEPMSRLRAIAIAVAIVIAGLCIACAFALLLPQ